MQRMHPLSGPLGVRSLSVALLAAGALAAAANGQITYTIDWESASIGECDTACDMPITEGDLLRTTFHAGGRSSLFISAGITPSPGLCLPRCAATRGHDAGTIGEVEVDALSYGHDMLIDNAPSVFAPPAYLFSVDEWAVGRQLTYGPTVHSEGAMSAGEAAADVFVYYPTNALTPGRLPMWPNGPLPDGNIGVLDGNGLNPSQGRLPLELVEPHWPAFGLLIRGDNLDGFDLEQRIGDETASFPIYFSLDSGDAVMDAFEGVPGSASACCNGAFVGGDVLVVRSVGALPELYASALELGLDKMIPDEDDLDALALRDNGDGIFQRPTGPYSWVDGSTDMILFSVRRGSAVIGRPDAFFSIPIEEGDILMPGPVGGPPGIWLPAEELGLHTMRTHGPTIFGGHGDDLDALDVAPDCDGDGIPDAQQYMDILVTDCDGNDLPDICDIEMGRSCDSNGNGILDECEDYCTEDTDTSCGVDVVDLVNVIQDWDTDGTAHHGDVNRSGHVDVADLVAVILRWGPC